MPLKTLGKRTQRIEPTPALIGRIDFCDSGNTTRGVVNLTTCRTTKHSEKRIKERCGCGKSAQKKVAMLALEHGIKHSDVSGSLKKYFDYLYFREQTANNIRIWGDKVFIFRGDCLITVLQLPPKYKKICDQIRSRLE